MAFFIYFVDLYLEALVSLSIEVGGVMLFAGLNFGLALGLLECEYIFCSSFFSVITVEFVISYFYFFYSAS